MDLLNDAGDLGLGSAHLAGHSYGGWLALGFALERPDRVRSLGLLAPSGCFTGLRLGYLLHGAPAVLWPSRRRTASLLAWETRGAPLDRGFVALAVAAGARRWGPVLRPRPPAADELRALDLPVRLLLAAADRSMDNGRCRTNAQLSIRDLRCRTLEDASHHSVPVEHGAEIAEFLAGPDSR